MIKKKEKLFSKIVMLVFLALIVIGFTIPGFMNSEEPTQFVEPRICQNDADCYLMCDIPLAALCSQNICQQNSCMEEIYYPFEQNSLTFTLMIKINNSIFNLEEYSNPKDIFVKFSGQEVQVFTSGLSLSQILEKLSMNVNAKCLQVRDHDFCSDKEKELFFMINKEESFLYGDHVPKEADIVEITYSILTP